MPTNYCGKSITDMAYMINHVPFSTLQSQVHFNVLHEAVSVPAIPNLLPRVFGFVAFSHLHKPLRSKLEPRALRCIFGENTQHWKGYRYHPPSRKLYVTLDVVFHKDVMHNSTPKSPIKKRIEMNYKPLIILWKLSMLLVVTNWIRVVNF